MTLIVRNKMKIKIDKWEMTESLNNKNCPIDEETNCLFP